MGDISRQLRTIALVVLLINSLTVVGLAFGGSAVAATNESLTAESNTPGVTSTVTASAMIDTEASTNANAVNITSSAFDLSDVSTTNLTVSNGSTTASDLEIDTQTADELNVTIDTLSFDTKKQVTVDIAGLVIPNRSSPSVQVGLYSAADSRIFNRFTSEIDVATEATNTGRFNYSVEDSAGAVGDGTTLYQGEEDVTIYPPATATQLNPGSFERTAGSAEGGSLSLPMPTDQPTGPYANSDASVQLTVTTPRITTFEVKNNQDEAVNGGLLNAEQTNAKLDVEYNFGDAERVELTVEDESGTDVTNEFLASNEDEFIRSENGMGTIRLDLGGVDAGEYTFTVEGEHDLDSGEATQSTTITVSTSTETALTLDNNETTQGLNLEYTIEKSSEGTYHAVTIDGTDLRDGISAGEALSIMRSVGDTTETGVVHENRTISKNLAAPTNGTVADEIAYVYAVVEIDGGDGVGSIETQYLDDATVTADLYPASDPANGYASGGTLAGTAPLASIEPIASTDFAVSKGNITLASPRDTYMLGAETAVNGTAEGLDEVAIYARNNNAFELVALDNRSTIQVDSDGTFETTDVELSGGTLGNDILSRPGTYRLGVIDAVAADTGPDTDGTPDKTLTSSEFYSSMSAVSAITVDTRLDAQFVTYNGQVARRDGVVDLEGDAPGQDEVAMVLIGPRGRVIADTVAVGSDGQIEETNIDLGTLNEGTVTGVVVSPGRDETYGDDTAPETPTQLVDAIETEAASKPASTSQIRSRIRDSTVAATGSDDLIVTQQFEYTDGQLTIETAGPAETGGTLTIVGATNVRPTDTTIMLNLLDGNRSSLELASTTQWGPDGRWSAEMGLGELPPGEYTLEADNGDTTARTTVEILEEGALEIDVDVGSSQSGTDTDESDTSETNESTGESDSTADTSVNSTNSPPERGGGSNETEADDAADNDSSSNEASTADSGETEDQPGFKLVFTLLALFGAGLLVGRRNA